jgi:hypothetical protein
MPVERAGKALADRIRAGEDVAAKIKLAEATGKHRDLLHLFVTWRNDSIAELKAIYERKETAMAFEFATETMEPSFSSLAFEDRKRAISGTSSPACRLREVEE